MMNICVYAAANEQVKQAFKDEARDFGAYLASKSYRLIYGGGGLGLMGAVANGALENGGAVTGILPQFMIEREWQHPSVEDIHIVQNMHERKEALMLQSRAVVALPGGCGTFEELMEAITWKKLGLYEGEVFIFNSHDYYRPLLDLIAKAVEEGFMDDEPVFTTVESLADLKDKIESLNE